MAKTKPYVKFWPFPLYFGPILGRKWSVKREALPMGPQSPSLYFWNQWNQENQISWLANSKSDFWFFCPPLVYIANNKK